MFLVISFIRKLLFDKHLSKLSRFTNYEQNEECAFSGHSDFSRNGRGKNKKKIFCGGKKETNLLKIAGNGIAVGRILLFLRSKIKDTGL